MLFRSFRVGAAAFVAGAGAGAFLATGFFAAGFRVGAAAFVAGADLFAGVAGTGLSSDVVDFFELNCRPLSPVPRRPHLRVVDRVPFGAT